MQLKTIHILAILITISACSSQQRVLPVITPVKPYVGTVRLSSILKCPTSTQKEVFRHLRQRDQYIETLIDVIDAHNGELNK